MTENNGHSTSDFEPFADADDVLRYLEATRTWGRWGDDDQVGALNLITRESRVKAASLVREGIAISLSRPLKTTPGPGNPRPTQHHLEKAERKGGAGVARDHIAMGTHGTETTHLDAISHVWGGDGMWGGADPHRAIQFDGSTWGGIEHWSAGIFARCVLLDVPRFRGVPYVTSDAPVTGAELQEILLDQDGEIRPGDAIAVYSGRDNWEMENPPYGADAVHADESNRPGLDVSCLKFIRNHEVSTVLWDMTDNRPIAFGLAYGVHAAIYAYGVALVDSSNLGDLARQCARLERTDFLVTVAPIVLRGATATPVNPIAIL